MTEVYLGKPPAYIETWMKENIQTEKWVPAVYTDQWLFSDGEKYTLSVTQQFNFYYWTAIDSDGGQLTSYNTFTDKSECDTSISASFSGNSNPNAYRIYTPEHWEDGNGNWINGSWKPLNYMNEIYDPALYGCSWYEVGKYDKGGWEFNVQTAGWYSHVTGQNDECLESTDKNACIIKSKVYNASWYRTWTNSKPAPAV